MKKILTLLIVFAIMLALQACGQIIPKTDDQGNYSKGVYYGYDSESKYYAVVMVSDNGMIEGVLLDAINCSDTDGDNIKETCDTKQGLGVAGYPMNMVDENGTLVNKVVEDAEGNVIRTKLNWQQQADKLASAITSYQGWSPDWQIIRAEDSGDSHDRFAAEVDGTLTAADKSDENILPDDIAGVTVGIEGFEQAVQDALGNASQ